MVISFEAIFLCFSVGLTQFYWEAAKKLMVRGGIWWKEVRLFEGATCEKRFLRFLEAC